MASELDTVFFYHAEFKKDVEEFIREKYNLPGFHLQIIVHNTMFTRGDLTCVPINIYLYGLRHKIVCIDHLAGERDDSPSDVMRHIDDIIARNRNMDADEYDLGYCKGRESKFKDPAMIISTGVQYPEPYDKNNLIFKVYHDQTLFLDQHMKSLTKLRKQMLENHNFDETFDISCTNRIPFAGTQLHMKYRFKIANEYLNTFYECVAESDEDFTVINKNIVSLLLNRFNQHSLIKSMSECRCA